MIKESGTLLYHLLNEEEDPSLRLQHFDVEKAKPKPVEYLFGCRVSVKVDVQCCVQRRNGADAVSMAENVCSGN